MFALTVHLNEVGVFTWSEWADVFAAHLAETDANDSTAAADGSDYYHRWAAALEDLLGRQGLTTGELVDDVAASWERAAEATPHGQPIELANDPAR